MTLKKDHTYISIIVPIYNPGRSLSGCINSLLRQDIPLSNYEIILVDDASTDPETIRIINGYKDHGNIKIITEKENSGVSKTRNTGLGSAQGDYVWFVDSDDEIKQNCLGRLLEFALVQEIDYLEFPILDNYVGTEKEKISNIKKMDRIMAPDEFAYRFDIANSMCAAISKREIWTENNIRFIDGHMVEDYLIPILLVGACKRIHFFYSTMGWIYKYNIGINPNSATTRKDINYDKIFSSHTLSINTLRKNFGNQNDKYAQFVKKYRIPAIKSLMLSLLLKAKIDIKKKREYINTFTNENIFLDRILLPHPKRNIKLLAIGNTFYRSKILYNFLVYIFHLFKRHR